MMKIFFVCFWFITNLTFINGEVLQLASNNISQYLQKHVTFVKFYSNWCPHSKKFEPIWNSFAAMKDKSDVRVGKVDCSNEALLCSDHDIFGYPTVKLFVRGSGARYEGPRDVQSLEAFYQDMAGKDKETVFPSKEKIVDLNEQNFIEQIRKDFSFVMFFAPWCQHCQVLKPIFEQLAEEMSNTENLLFGKVDCTIQNNLCAKNEIRGYPTLIWFENGEAKDRYNSDREVQKMRFFIEQKMLSSKKSSFVETSSTLKAKENLHQFDEVLTVETFRKGTSFEGYAFVNFGAPWCSHCQKLLPLWNQLAQRFSSIDEIRIVRVDCTISESLCRDFGIRAFPTMILFRYGESKVEYTGPRDFNSLYNFLVTQLESYGDEYLLETKTE